MGKESLIPQTKVNTNEIVDKHECTCVVRHLYYIRYVIFKLHILNIYTL